MEEKQIKKGISDAQKRACRKYLENNRDKINLQRKRYYIERKEKDPNFLKYKRDKSKEYYNKHIKKNNDKVDKKDEINDVKNLDFEIKF